MHYINLHFCQMQFIGGFSPSIVEKVTQRKTVILYFSVQINSSLLVFMFINNCRILWGRGTVKRNEMKVTNLKGKENLVKPNIISSLIHILYLNGLPQLKSSYNSPLQ